MTWVRISAPHFCAAIEIGGRFAPILHYMRGWPLHKIELYCLRKGWTTEVFEDE